jgi:hypothetical protein
MRGDLVIVEARLKDPDRLRRGRRFNHCVHFQCRPLLDTLQIKRRRHGATDTRKQHREGMKIP